MAVYAYKGLSSQGKAVNGIIDADNPKGARLKLRREGIFPTDVTEEQRRAKKIAGARTEFNLSFFAERINPQELALLTRQLSTLVGAGLPLVDCLSALIEQVESARTKRMLSQIREQVTEGASLADALKAHPRVFTDLYVNMVRAGEASGALDVVLAAPRGLHGKLRCLARQGAQRADVSGVDGQRRRFDPLLPAVVRRSEGHQALQ